jgi:NADH-quinone oxidoreductase subunit L
VYTWIEVGRLKLELAFRLDTLSAVMILIVTFVGLLIHIYSAGYMAHDPRYAAFFGYLNLFMGSMLTLVLASNMPVMFIGWEAWACARSS